jgi:hypothetical protein
MSVGSNLQEMENVVTKGAAPAEPMPKLSTGIAPGQTGAWEDLGGPTPENYRTDDNSARLNTPGATLQQVKNIVNAKAAAADPMQGFAKEDAEYDEDEALLEDSTEEAPEPKNKNKNKNKRENGQSEDDSEDGDDSKDDKDDEDEMKEEFDIEEDVNALLSGEDLSEEFQEKARTIFETAIRSKVAEIKEELQETYENALIEEIEVIKQGLVERVDAYLEYVADEWVAENALAIEAGLKTEMTESFLLGMRGLFEDHYVSIPEEKYDVIESMVDKLDEMEEKLNEQIERNIALNNRLAESVADVIFADVAEGLALSQKDKLASLAENVEFDSESDYREKLVTLRESYFPSNAGTQREFTENLSESVEYPQTPQVSGIMESYLSVLSRTTK